MRRLRIEQWSWWRKSRLLAFFAAGLPLLMALAIGLAANDYQGSDGPSLRWIGLSVFPLTVVLLLSIYARLQARVDLDRDDRSGPNRNRREGPWRQST